MASKETTPGPSKESKDLATLIAVIRSSKTKLDIDWDKYMKLDNAPTKAAASMRVTRLGKSLGLELRGGGKTPKKDETTKRKAAGKNKQEVEVYEGEVEEDKPEETPSKKAKVKGTTNSAGQSAEDV